MKPRTLNQIIKTLEIFAYNHEQIHSFGTGFKTDLNSNLENNLNLSILFSEYRGIALNSNTQTYNFRIYSLDAKQKDNYNSRDILSDTAQILTDLRKWLIYNTEQNNIQWSLTSTNNLVPVNNFTNDWLVGWYMDINISTALIESDCDVPLDIIDCLTPYVELEYVQEGYTLCQNFTIPTPEPGSFNVILTDIGNTKLRVIIALRELLDIGLSEAKYIVEEVEDNGFATVLENVTEIEANTAKTQLETAGASVTISINLN